MPPARLIDTIAARHLPQVLIFVQPPPIPAAPVPAQVLSAHRVFISNGESTGTIWPSSLVYDAFYAGIKSWGKYEIVSAPAESDVVFEVRYLVGVPPGTPERVQLFLIDPKTHITLWNCSTRIEVWGRDDTGRKNFEAAIAALLGDVKRIAASSDETK